LVGNSLGRFSTGYYRAARKVADTEKKAKNFKVKGKLFIAVEVYMKKLVNLKVLVCLLVIMVAGCGSSGDGAEPNSEDLKPDLYLYSTTSDHYFKISGSGDVQYFKCSISDGYVPVEKITGTYLNNQLTLNYYGEESVSTLLKSDEGGYIQYTDSSIIPYVIVESVPMFCENDVVEITSFSPINAVAGLETEFVINIDYRLASEDVAVIYPKFDSAALNKFSFNYDKIDVTSGTRSASFSAMMTPINGVGIESLVSIKMMGLVEGGSNIYYEMTEDSIGIAIFAPEDPIVSESLIGTWKGDCIQIYDRLSDSYSRNYRYEISSDEIIWSYDLFSDNNCADYLETKTYTDQYVLKGMVEAVEGIQVHLLETRFVHGGYIGEPKESFFFAHNNVLFGLSRNEETNEIGAAFIDPYFLEN